MNIIKESWAVDLVSCVVMSTAQLFQDLEFWITYTLDIDTVILIFGFVISKNEKQKTIKTLRVLIKI